MPWTTLNPLQTTRVARIACSRFSFRMSDQQRLITPHVSGRSHSRVGLWIVRLSLMVVSLSGWSALKRTATQSASVLCCGVKGRFKKCKAIYNGFVALVDQSLNENWKGIIGSKAFGFNGVSLTGRPLDLHHYFMTGINCAGKNCRTITLRMRKLYCE